jgi:hypothetical protein
MKIIDRKAFLALPGRAICCEGQPWAFGGWFRKDGNCGVNDYFVTTLDWTQFEHTSSDASIESADRALATNARLPLTFDQVDRDGCFRDDAVYCVLEDGDIDALVRVLLAGKGRA